MFAASSTTGIPGSGSATPGTAEVDSGVTGGLDCGVAPALTLEAGGSVAAELAPWGLKLEDAAVGVAPAVV